MRWRSGIATSSSAAAARPSPLSRSASAASSSSAKTHGPRSSATLSRIGCSSCGGRRRGRRRRPRPSSLNRARRGRGGDHGGREHFSCRSLAREDPALQALPDVVAALDRGAPLVGIVAALWALRPGSGALGRFERTASYAWLAWWLAAALQWARADDAVGGGLKPELAADGVVIVGLGAVLRLVRNEWPRPHPALVAADEIHAALNGTLLARRVNRVVGTVGFAALIWAFTQSL